jgi:rhodanese-related sulfurtransferase
VKKTAIAIMLLSALALGALGGGLVALLVQPAAPTAEQHIAEYYAVENAVHVSPHSLRKKMDANDTSFVLVDLRSAQEYAEEHIRGAISIPAYRDPDHPAYYDVDRIVSAFAALPKRKEIIVYCYSEPCMTGRKIGLLLSEHGIFVKHLNIGWNEWRYDWAAWNHPREWNRTRAEDYVERGVIA